jgi:hypothetical protein
MTNPLFCRRESHERGRQTRKYQLNEHQTKQARRLELIEKVVGVLDSAVSSLKTEINYDERIFVHITSCFEGVPDVHLELCRDGASDLLENDDLPF